MAKTDWNPLLRSEFDQAYWHELTKFVHDERTRHQVFPPHDEVFAALHHTSFESVKAVVLGQDPYHGPGQAHGLCFSVRPGVPPPPSLKNIFTELESDLGIPRPQTGSLLPWAEQGVLLLNTTLTVRARQAASHQGKGWEQFTDRIIEAVSQKTDRVVFVLWGSAARRKKQMIDLSRHGVVESTHPSPLSAHRGFMGSRPFSQVNHLLEEAGRTPIDWRLDQPSATSDESAPEPEVGAELEVDPEPESS